MALSEQQERFCRLLAQGKNQTDAYKEAGYKCANDNVAAVGASNLIRNPKVALRLKALQEGAAKRAELTAAGFAARLNRLALAAEKKAITESEEAGDEFASKEAADVARQSIMDAAKLLGLIVDQSKVQSENVNYNISDEPMTEDEWEAEYAAEDAVEPPARTPGRVN